MSALAISSIPGHMRGKVAALFVDPDGPYPGMHEVASFWDLGHDARNYDGPLPVVAHPPCQLWVNLAHVNYKRYGKGQNRPGNDHGCFASALYSVRRWGGVLEHPAKSNAWQAHGLTPPGETIGWRQTALCEWVCEVNQAAWGHKARKKTWLFYCGRNPPLEGRWERPRGTHQVGWFDRKKPTLSKREANATPDAFAQWLVDLAAHSVAAPSSSPDKEGSNAS